MIQIACYTNPCLHAFLTITEYIQLILINILPVLKKFTDTSKYYRPRNIVGDTVALNPAPNWEGDAPCLTTRAETPGWQPDMLQF